jgi:hypothetical protein
MSRREGSRELSLLLSGIPMRAYCMYSMHVDLGTAVTMSLDMALKHKRNVQISNKVLRFPAKYDCTWNGQRLVDVFIAARTINDARGGYCIEGMARKICNYIRDGQSWLV